MQPANVDSEPRRDLLETIAYVLLIVMLAVAFAPIAQRVIPTPLQVASVVAFVFIAFVASKDRSSDMVAFLAPFLPALLLILMTQVAMRPATVEGIALSLYVSVLWILPPLMCFYLIARSRPGLALRTLRAQFVIVTVTVITSIVGLMRHPLAARILATDIGSDDPTFQMYNFENIAGFNLIYFLVVAFPMLVACRKQGLIGRLPFLVILGSVSAYVFLAEFAFALGLLSLAFVSLFVPKKGSRFSFALMALGTTSALFLIMPYAAGIADYLAATTDSVVLSLRLQAFSDLISGTGSSNDDFSLRQSAYIQSIDAFVRSPFWGTGVDRSVNSGEHSFFLDFLAQFGILGAGALCLVYGQIYSKLYLPHRGRPYYGYMLWSLLMAIVLAFINPTASVYAIAFTVPLVGYALGHKQVQEGKGEWRDGPHRSGNSNESRARVKR